MSVRIVLSVALCGLTLFVGLAACLLESVNHERAQELARLQREWEMTAAANAQMRAAVSSHVWGVANDELDVKSAARGAGADL